MLIVNFCPQGLPILKTLPVGDINSVDQFIERMSPIFPAVEWRITLKGEAEENSAASVGISGMLLVAILVIQITSKMISS